MHTKPSNLCRQKKIKVNVHILEDNTRSVQVDILST